LDEILELYSQVHDTRFVARLGEGKDGEVFQTDRMTAVKFLTSLEYFHREERAYRILADLGTKEIAGHFCPMLVRSDDTFLAIEMTIVRPPFIVDFVSAYTDDELERLNFTEDVLEEREAFWQERFGERWAKVRQICAEFHQLTGLTLLDLSHNNIRFE
jgi:hypothetical protein